MTTHLFPSAQSYIEVSVAGLGPDHLREAAAAFHTAQSATGLQHCVLHYSLLIWTCSKHVAATEVHFIDLEF